MPLDRRITIKTAERRFGTLFWAELLDNKVFAEDTFSGTLVQYNATVVYRIRYVDYLVEARASTVQVTDRLGEYVYLQSIREDTKGGRRRYLILEGKAF